MKVIYKIYWIIILSAFIFWGSGVVKSSKRGELFGPIGPAKLGEPVPHFRAVDPHNRFVALGDFKGQWVLLNFWVSWCDPCREEMPSLLKLAEKLHPKVKVVAISSDQNWESVFKLLNEIPGFTPTGSSIKFLLDPGGNIARKFGTFKYPETYLISPEGILTAKWIGAYNWLSPKVIGKIESLLQR